MADILLGNVKGPKGDTGDTGATGAPGAAGTDGAAATINVGTVTTSAYGTTAQVTNSGTESAAVFDFVIPQGKPGEETTRMSGLTLDQITAQTASMPVPAVGESGSVIWGKVVKFFNDVKTSLATKLSGSDCVTVLTSSETQKPLAASAGKALSDTLTRKFVGSIAGGGVLEICANVCTLQFTVTQYDPNGTVIPSQYRPKFGNRCWSVVAVTNDYTSTYVLNVGNDGSVQMQKNGVIVTQSVNGVRGQITWAI